MIWAGVVVAKPEVEITKAKVVGLYTGLLVVHGILNSVGTKFLARFTSSFVFVNLGTTISKISIHTVIKLISHFFQSLSSYSLPRQVGKRCTPPIMSSGERGSLTRLMDGTTAFHSCLA
jgi:hypothetical protein